MSAVHRIEDVEPVEAEPAPTPPSTLTERLEAKLAELTGAGYRIQYLEVAKPQMVALFAEGGEDAIRLDPDPSVDKAWYRDFEVRPTSKGCIWIWLEGEYPEPSAHVID